MILVVGGVASGKRTYARSLGFAECDMVLDAHELVRERAGADAGDAGAGVDALVERLSAKRVVTCAEVGAGVVPIDAGQRAWRERAGRLMAGLADRADVVVRMMCGIPVAIKGALPVDYVQLDLIRHGSTPGNELRQYVGVLDQPLSARGVEQARHAGARPDVSLVYVSRLQRAQQTARIMFPNARQVAVDGIHEMDFGDFAGRSAEDMADDPAYRAWVEGGCEGRCPHGETRAEFSERVCMALERLLRDAAARGERRITVVAHGGTMMASLSRFAQASRAYYDWLVGNCEGYRIRACVSPGALAFQEVVPL